MKKYKLFIVTSFSFCFLSFCSAPLERPGVPVWVGIRVEAELDTAVLGRELDSLRGWGFAGVVLEGVLKADTRTDTLRWEAGHADALRQAIRVCQGRFPWALAASAGHSDSLLRRPLSEVDTVAMCMGLARAWTEIFADGYPVGFSLGTVGANAGRAFPTLGCPLPDSVEWVAYVLPYDFPWPTPQGSVLALTVPTPPEGNAKAFAQSWHPLAADAARKTALPVFLVQTNLLGPHRLLELKNHLRFWPEDVVLQGIVLNTVYPTPSVLDSVSRFGLAQEAELLRWLRAYLRGGERAAP